MADFYQLAVELLLEGVPKERQVQLEVDLMRVRRKDPIAQAEALRGDTAIQDVLPVETAANYPRHKKRGPI